MGDEDDGSALVAQGLHDGHELVDLLRGEHGSGLVQDEVLGVIGQGLEDLDALLDADRQVLDHRVRVDVEVIAIRQLAHLRAGSSHRQHTGSRFLSSEHDVLGHREHVDEHEMLVDHPDTGRHGLLGIVEVLLHAIDVDRSLVRGQQPVQDVHEGRLAGTVLTEQAMDAPGNDVEVDVVVGRKRPESLRDSAQTQSFLDWSAIAGWDSGGVHCHGADPSTSVP